MSNVYYLDNITEDNRITFILFESQEFFLKSNTFCCCFGPLYEIHFLNPEITEIKYYILYKTSKRKGLCVGA